MSRRMVNSQQASAPRFNTVSASRHLDDNTGGCMENRLAKKDIKLALVANQLDSKNWQQRVRSAMRVPYYAVAVLLIYPVVAIVMITSMSWKWIRGKEIL